MPTTPITGEIPPGERVALRLPDHAVNYGRLQALMTRVGAANLDPFDFLCLVQRTYQELQPASTAAEMHKKLRMCPSHAVFRAALDCARKKCRIPERALVIGCGEGYAGLPATYAVNVLQSVLPSADSLLIQELNVTPEMLHTRVRLMQKFDVVVTHSMAHRVPGLQPFFAFVDEHLARGGVFVMGHEPNARFFRNAECLASLRELRAANRRGRRLRGLADPLRWWNRLVRLAGKRQELPLLERVNQAMRTKHRFTSDLTAAEITRLIDVHRPAENGGGFSIGCNGFDCDEVEREFLPGYQRLWLGTSGHLGYTHANHLPQDWQKRNARLAEQYPEDGAVLSVCWRKHSPGPQEVI